MSREYIVTCCSTVDLDKAFLEEKEIPYIAMHYRIGDQEFADDLYTSITAEEFYKQIEEGAEPVTSQLNQEEYMKFWEPYVREGRDILHLTLSSGISGTINSARLAAEALMETYPEAQIVVVDSLAASSGYGMLTVTARENQLAGMDIHENAAWIEAHRNQLHHWFFSTDLTSYIRGGRVSKVSGFVGTVLKICPLLNVNCEGKLIPREKSRGRKKAIQDIFAKMQKHVQNGTDYTGKVYMCHSADYKDARAVADLIEAAYPSIEGKVKINNIGTVIGSHSGPGTVAVFFWGDERTE